MGVMLTLDQPGQVRGRRRGQHQRTPEEQACLDAFAAFLRSDALGAGRCLSRLGTTVLARRLLPAAKALADAVDSVLSDEGDAQRQVPLNFTVSPVCLLGQCRSGRARPGSARPGRGGLDDDEAGGTSVCQSPACEHDCHAR